MKVDDAHDVESVDDQETVMPTDLLPPVHPGEVLASTATCWAIDSTARSLGARG